MKKVLLPIFIFIFAFALSLQATHRILIGSPIRQKPQILKEFLLSLQRLEGESYALDYFFIDDNDLEESKEILIAFQKEAKGMCLVQQGTPSSSLFVCDEITHFWRDDLVWKVASYKNQMIDYARSLDYDYLFLIDSDLVLHPQSLQKLISDQKEIVSTILWTSWVPDSAPLPQVWLSDTYTLFEREPSEKITDKEAERRIEQFLQKLKVPGVYEVGGLGACTLISRSALRQPIGFERIKNLSFWGEDRHFCTRAAALGIPLFVDTHFPAFHIYRESELEGARQFAKQCEREQKMGYRLTLSVLVKEGEEEALRSLLESARPYITEAVIVGDMTDQSLAAIEESLQEIPHRVMQNKQSSDHFSLRKQLWVETVKNNPDWILSLNACQILDDSFQDAVYQLVTAEDVDVYSFSTVEGEAFIPCLARYQHDRRYVWIDASQTCGNFPLTILNLPGKRLEIKVKNFSEAQ